MNRSTTKLLGTLVFIATIFFVLFFTFGSFLLPIVSSLTGKNLSLNGAEFFLLFPIGCVGFLVIFVLSWIVGYRRDAHRREDLQKLARQNSWSYTQSTKLPFLNEFDSFLNDSWDGNTLNGSSNNVLIGKMNGRNIVVSDQIYSTGSGKHRRTHKETIVGVELPEVFLPIMCLYPEGFMDKVFDTLARYDIDFENYPLFSQKYVLYGKNRNQIQSFFTPQILSFYEQQPGFTTVCGGKYLVIYGFGLLKPHQILERLRFIFTLANLFLRK